MAGLSVTVLGSSGAWPERGRACSGFLVRHREFHLVLDLGYSTLANAEKHLPPEKIDAVIVTHAHPDHYLDLHPLFRARYFSKSKPPPLPLFAPAGVFERLLQLEEPVGEETFRRTFRFHEITPGDSFRIGPFRVSTRSLPHYVPNAGIRLEADGLALAYTGDTGPSPEVAALADDADLFIAEATNRGDPSRFDPRYHLTAGEAGEYAESARARRLLLTHFWPGLARSSALAEARHTFSGPVSSAEENRRLSV